MATLTRRKDGREVEYQFKSEEDLYQFIELKKKEYLLRSQVGNEIFTFIDPNTNEEITFIKK